MDKSSRSSNRWRIFYTLALLAASILMVFVVSFIYPLLVVISAISFIGIPIALALIYALPVLVYLTGIMILWIGLRIWSVPRAALLSVLIVAMTGLGYPILLNRQGETIKSQILEPDFGPAPLAELPSVLEYVESGHVERRPSCDKLCQLLLTQGHAKIVGVGYRYPADNNSHNLTDTHNEAIRYYALRQQENCPKLVADHFFPQWLQLKDSTTTNYSERQSEFARQQASGPCLSEIPASEVPPTRLRYDLYAIDTSKALSAGIDRMYRVQVHLLGSEQSQLLFSRTSARLTRLTVPLILTLDGGFQLQMHYGWSKTVTYLPDSPEVTGYDRGRTKPYAELTAAGLLPLLDGYPASFSE